VKRRTECDYADECLCFCSNGLQLLQTITKSYQKPEIYKCYELSEYSKYIICIKKQKEYEREINNSWRVSYENFVRICVSIHF
jgi:hypothetical protein